MGKTLTFNSKTTNIMNLTSEKIKGNWNVIKGKVKAKYGELTDDDLTYIEGKEDELLGRIQKRTGQAKEEIKNFIDSI
jgi:uncharacterized protein YjbJ (UPF0337 family)